MELPFFKKEFKIPKVFEAESITVADIVAPSSIEINQSSLKFGEKLARSYFIFSFPRYLNTGWFFPVINLEIAMDVSIFLHPVGAELVLKQLRKQVTNVEAEITEREEKGLIRDPVLEIAYRDLESLRDSLHTAQERMFQLGIYLTVYADSEKELRDIEITLRSILESRLVYIKPNLFQQREGFISTAPYGLDLAQVYTSMNTAPLSSIFPFISADLSSNEGILYGVNKSNNSLVLFDRFSLENANSTVFATSGSGKSYSVKLEILRYLMLGTDVIIIDPENEYNFLSEAVGGTFVNMSLSAPSHINPFDLPEPREDERPEDVLRSNIMNLVGLIRIMLGGLNPEEDAIIDRALTETYEARDITPFTDPRTWKSNIPVMSDLETVLEGMEGAQSLVTRLRKFTKGTFSDFFNQPTNISMDNPFVVFGIRNMEDELRPMAMYMIMRYIWNEIRAELKRRILVVDEAWWLMQTEDGASFLYGVVKRARKYWLGVTTITQDVVDFMKSSYGQPIVNNSALRLLLKQSTAAIDLVQKTFNLTEEEKYLLLESAVGEGMFFAGPKHVAIRIVASYTEDQIVTSSPEEVLRIRRAKEELAK